MNNNYPYIRTPKSFLLGALLFITVSCSPKPFTNSQSSNIAIDVETVLNRIKNYHNNNHLVKTSWDYKRISTAYSDTDYNSYTFIRDTTIDFSVKTVTNWNYFEYLKTSTAFYKDSVGFFFNPFIEKDSCKRKIESENLKSSFKNMPPFMHKNASNLNIINHDSSIIQIKSYPNGDSLLITNNFAKSKYTLFVNSLGQYEYYEQELRGQMIGIDIIQRDVFDNFTYKDTSSLDVDLFLSIKECPPYKKREPEPLKEIVDIDSFFLNKKFDYSKMGGYLDTSIFTNSGKITLLDYSWLGCGPCLLIMNIFPRLLDSFENELQLVFIDPVTDTSQSVFATQLLNKHELNGRVEYKLMSHAEDIFTFNGVIEAYPVLLIIDKNGIVRKVKTGIEKDEDAFETLYKMIKEVLKE